MPRGSARGELGTHNGGDATGLLGTDGARLVVGALSTPTDGHVLTYDSGTATIRLEAAAGGGIGGSTGATDNALLRADGTGGSTLQSSAATLDESGNLSGIAALSVTTIELGHASDTTLSRAAAGVIAVEGVRIQPVNSASAPTVNDDSGDGYAVGQMWVDTTTKLPYVLVDSTVGAAVWRSLLNADAAEIRLESGAWVWASQAWNGSAWVDISASTALTVETTNASITFSGTTLTLASGLTDGGSSPHLAQSKAYVALADLPIWSSTTGAVYRVEMSQTSMGSGSAYARWGWALATPTGNYDANTETHTAMRGGYDGPTWIWRYAVGTGTFGSGYSNATIPSIVQLWFTPGLATTSYYIYSSATSSSSNISPPTAVPTRLYAIAMAGGGTLTSNVDVVNPKIRIIRLPGSP